MGNLINQNRKAMAEGHSITVNPQVWIYRPGLFRQQSWARKCRG